MHDLKKLLLLLMMIGGIDLSAQHFSEKWSVVIPDTYQHVQAEWGDMDNDGLLDVVIHFQDAGSDHITVVKGDTVAIPVFDDALNFPVIPSDKFFLLDFNADNQLDIIVPGIAGTTAKVYLNRGGFQFQVQETTVPSFSKMLFADIDNDIVPEWLVSHVDGAQHYLSIYKQAQDEWTPAHRFEINAVAFDVVDTDQNGYRDLFVSGSVDQDSSFTGILVHKQNFAFDVANAIDAHGVAAIGDLNHDGSMDVIFNGQRPSGAPVNKVFLSADRKHVVRDSVFQSLTPTVMIADFNSDGKADVNYWSKIASGDSLSLIKTGTLAYDTIALQHVISERFGDADHDGDLDALHVVRNDSTMLVLMDNNAAHNGLPNRPTEVLAFTFFDHIFMKWRGASDDHTPTEAITYDLFFEGVNPGDFDITTERRLKVNHGNNGASDFLLARMPDIFVSQYSLEPVDNAFHAGRAPGPAGVPGICVGAFIPCENLKLDTIAMCSKQKRTFTATAESSWYSFSNGYLSTGMQLDFQSGETSEVLFSFTPANPSCASVHAWYITVKDSTHREFIAMAACENETISLDAGDEWEMVHWTSNTSGPLGTTSAISYDVTGDDVVHAMLSNDTGCLIDRAYEITMSTPEVKITTDNTFVLAGKSIQLHASGAETYTWVDTGDMSSTSSPDPIVTPLESKDYTVTGRDSAGCVGQAVIRITVEKNGFIPSLFTPNNDGKNDMLRVYGVGAAAEFSFEIFNRNGSKVFSASSVGELTRGWDGTSKGVKQPGGVYFWKVNGKLLSGEKIQFNGKDNGSIVLIR